MCGWQIKLWDPVVTYEPYLSASEIKGLYIKRCINSSVYFTLLQSVIISKGRCLRFKPRFRTLHS